MAEDIENQIDGEDEDLNIATSPEAKDGEGELDFSDEVRNALLRQMKVEYDSLTADKLADWWKEARNKPENVGIKHLEVSDPRGRLEIEKWAREEHIFDTDDFKKKESYLKDLTDRMENDEYSDADFATMQDIFQRAISFQKEQIAFGKDQAEKDKRTDILSELENAQESFNENYEEEKTVEAKKQPEQAPEIKGTLTPKQESLYNQLVFEYEHDLENVDEKIKAYSDLMDEVGDHEEWGDKIENLKDMRADLLKQKELAETKLKNNSDVKYANLRDLEEANARKLADIDQKKLEEVFLKNAKELEDKEPGDLVGDILKENLKEARSSQKERDALRAELSKEAEKDLKIETKFNPEELNRYYEQARKERYTINDASRQEVISLLDGEKDKTEAEFAKKWCLENQDKLGVDLSQENDPKVFLEWAREKNAHQDASYESYGDKITRLLEVKGQMSGEGVGPISKAMALSELNLMSNALQDQLELAISVGDKDLIEEKQKQIDNLFKYREQLFCDIQGQSLDQYFGQTEYMQRLQNIQDKNEFDKEFKNFMDGEFDKFTYDKPEMVRNIYRSAILEKQMLLADQTLRKKKKEELLKLKQEFDNRGIDLKEVAENLAQAADQEKAKKLGINPEDAPPEKPEDGDASETAEDKDRRNWFEKNQDALAGILGLAAWIIFGFAGFIIGSAWQMLNDRTPKVFVNNFFGWITKKIKDVS